MNKKKWTVIDLFSGAGGMSLGFHKHKNFEIVAAVDAEKGKPSSGDGKLQCNGSYETNIGIKPFNIDLSTISPAELMKKIGKKVDVFIACPPCTGFSRANPNNHLVDDPRNSLVSKAAEFAVESDASVILMENARELMQGNFKHHFDLFRKIIKSAGYTIDAGVHVLNKFGLPQKRERALVIAAKKNIDLKNLEDLWGGYEINKSAATVRHAFQSLTYDNDPAHIYPGFSTDIVRKRIAAIPKDGGSWIDLTKDPKTYELLTEGMKKLLAKGKLGSFPDTYGRLAWQKPAPTIKRECGHIGNGRYAHPEENRLCSVREMAVLQGFPRTYTFSGSALSNYYRHIGDAVPPLISYQLANVVSWMLSGEKPNIEDIILPDTHLTIEDIKILEKAYEKVS